MHILFVQMCRKDKTQERNEQTKQTNKQTNKQKQKPTKQNKTKQTQIDVRLFLLLCNYFF
jgi:hypothetical protein